MILWVGPLLINMIIWTISVTKILLHNNLLCHKSNIKMLQCNWACPLMSKFCLLPNQVVTKDKITNICTTPQTLPLLLFYWRQNDTSNDTFRYSHIFIITLGGVWWLAVSFDSIQDLRKFIHKTFPYKHFIWSVTVMNLHRKTSFSSQ